MRLILSVLMAIGFGLGLGAPRAAAGPGDFTGGFGDVDAPKVVVSGAVRDAVVAPGGETVVAVVMEHQAGWHSWPDASVDLGEGFEFAIRTTLSLERPEWVGWVGATQWPETQMARVASFTGEGSVEKPTFYGKAVIYKPIRIAEDAPDGEYEIALSLGYQACDDTTCEMPEDVRVTVPITVRADAPVGSGGGEVFAGFDARGFAVEAETGGKAPVESAETGATRQFFGLAIPSADGPAGYALLAVLGLIGGFILNLTPCVLPVIPIKVMTISQHAGSPGKSLVLGLWMALGVVGFWAGIGVPAAFVTSFADPSILFGIWWLTLGLGLIILAMGVGIMGAFSINLPQSVYMVNPKADSAWGSFLFGVMTAVLGLPCFGFVAGALLVGAATMPKLAVISIFVSIGIGMALPYAVLAGKPQWIEKMPRTGPASELVKQFLGLLMIAAALYFVGSGVIAFVSERPGWVKAMPWWWKQVHWWAITVTAVAAGGWLALRTFQITKKGAARAVFGLVGLVVAAAPVLYAYDSTLKARDDFWVAYDQGELESALESGQVVVVDFTAEWCLNCKALKAAVLNREPVKGELLGSDVVAMTADLTSQKAPGWEKLRALGETGIPLLVVYGPGTDGPWKSNAYTTQDVMEALDRAKGVGARVSAR